MREEFTFANMRLFLKTGWADIGARTADKWLGFNQTYFGGVLLPVPMFFTNTTPFGRRVAHCCGNEECRHIALNMPKTTGHGYYELVADANTLLHEMIHQHCQQRGLPAAHSKQPWRDEIMRLHFQITGERIFAGGQRVIKERLEDGRRRSVRVLDNRQAGGLVPIAQAEIARWPHDSGIDLGKL